MKKRKKIIIYGIMLLFVIAAGVIYAAFNLPVNSGDAFLLNEHTREYEAIKYKNGFLTFDGKLLAFYETDMSQKWVVSTEESEASLSVSGDMILLYSDDSNKIYIYDDGALISEYASDKKIRSAAVNKSGYAVVLSSDSGYKGQCTVYDKSGKQLARYSYGKKYILAAYLADDNKNLFMNVVDEAENMFKGKLLFVNIDSGKVNAEKETEQIAPFTVMADNMIISSDDEGLKLYNKKGDEKWSFSYDGGRAEYIKYSNKIITLVLKGYEGAGTTSVLSFGTAGKLKGHFASEHPVDALDVSRGYAAIKTGNEIKLLNKRGNVTAVTDCDANTYEILLYESRNRVLTLSGSAEIKTFGR